MTATTWRRCFWVLLILALTLRAWVYVQGGRHLPVTTDEAITVLQAKRIAEGELQWLMYAQPYMIPFEAYATLPFLGLPRNAYSLRIVVVLECLMLLGITLWLLRSTGNWKATAAGWLIALFPSAYVLTNGYAYAFPHNNSAYLLTFLAIVGARQLQRAEHGWRWRLAWLLWTGFCAGLAFSNAMLTITILAPLLLVVLLQGRCRQLPLTLAGLTPGVLAGLLPFLYTKATFVGSHVGVSQSRDWAGAWAVMRSHLITFTMPRTLGLGAPAFPDEPVYGLDPGPAIALGGYLLTAAFLIALFGRAWTHLRTIARRQCPRLDLLDLSIGVFLATLLAFSKSARAASQDFRYLTPIAMVLPFAFAGFQQRLPPRLARLFLALVLAYGGFNVVSMARNASLWATPTFAGEVVNAPDLADALAILKRNNIRHCYAQHWTAYRINFLTDEAILCSQPYNSRFPSWFLPYKDVVSASDKVAYVLTSRNRDVTPAVFRQHLSEAGITCRIEPAGAYEVFLDFQPPPELRGRAVIAPARIAAIRSDSFAGDLQALWTDNNLHSRTHSLRLQEDGMAFEVTLTAPATLTMLRYNLGFWREDEPGALHVDAREGDGWRRVLDAGRPRPVPFTFRNRHPIYGGTVRTLAFPPVTTTALRVTLTQPNPRRAWTFSELECIEVVDAQPETP